MTITVDEVKDLGICIEINKTTVKKKVRMKKIQFLIKKNLNNKKVLIKKNLLAIVKPIQFILASPNHLQRSISILFLKFKFLSVLSKSKRTVIR
jgi:hypothetical protein